jgi:hypothetical protein
LLTDEKITLILIHNPFTMKKNRLLILFLLAMPFAVVAQGDLDELFNGSVNDAKYLSEGYISPMMKAVGYGMNQGWYNTARPHKFPGFDLTLSVNPVFIPSTDKIFNVDNNKLQSVTLTSDMDGKTPGPAGTGNIPTIFGAEKNTTYTADAPAVGSFSGPTGTGLNLLPMPTLNLGIGLPKGTDLKLRFVPNIDLGKVSNDEITGSFGLFGIGVMHDVKQWIPGIKELPFDLSGFVGYTKMTLEAGIDSGDPNQKTEFTCSATTIQGIISKKISVLTGYAGVGYNIAKTKLAVKGNYDFNNDGDATDNGEKDPFALEVDSNGLRATFGLRLKFGPIAFHGDYTLAKYNAASVGFGINVR